MLYSLSIKRIALADVVTLSGLFTLRVFAGAVLVFQPVSPWLLNFIAVFFLNLALVKRYTELRKAPAMNIEEQRSLKIASRGYVKDDEVLILTFGVAMASLALLSFFLYGLLAPNKLFESGIVIGAISAMLLFWMMRVWLLAHRGQMNDDPVLFAVKDRMSLGFGIIIMALVMASRLF